VLALAVAAAGCGDPTEVVVVSDTDFDVPRRLARFDVTVMHPDGSEQESTIEMESADQLPAYVGIVADDGPLGPYLVTVEGRRRNGRLLVRREAIFNMEDGEILVLPMHIVRACRGMGCGRNGTCGDDGSCRSILVEPDELREWDDHPPRLE